MTPEAKRQLIRHEGIRYLPYKDTAGHLTIGIGHNLEVPLSETVVDMIFNDDLMDVTLKLVMAEPWIFTLDDARRDVFINMAFNLGVSGLQKFRKMLDAARRGDWVKAAIEGMDSRWANQVGGRAIELMTQLETGVQA